MNTIRIERVILDGIELPRAEESRFRAALKYELALLFTGTDTPPLHGTPAAITSLAKQIARSVYESAGGKS